MILRSFVCDFCEVSSVPTEAAELPSTWRQYVTAVSLYSKDFCVLHACDSCAQSEYALRVLDANLGRDEAGKAEAQERTTTATVIVKKKEPLK